MTATAQSYIQALQLQPHPEGGFFSESYRSAQTMALSAPGGGTQQRNVCTAIYFLLEAGNFSAFHRIQSDEIWHFYAGQALEVLELLPDGQLCCTRLGSDVLRGEIPQYVVPANTWFASRVAEGGTFSLVGCTVAPGFDFADFRLARRQELLEIFPQHRPVITELTR
ncbi:MAG: cupin domain-containing protein [Rhodoferax sp.]|nr:cupin domain-containing protein [Rhodoferax sp.]